MEPLGRADGTAKIVHLVAETLQSADFRPFGSVLEFDLSQARSVNDGFALRADMPVSFAGPADHTPPMLAIYRATGRVLPIRVEMLERHPRSSQAFLPMTATGFLLVVAPEMRGGMPDLAAARAFVGGAGQGFNYRRGVWHAPLVALRDDGDFAMLMWETGGQDDCVTFRLSNPLHVRD